MVAIAKKKCKPPTGLSSIPADCRLLAIDASSSVIGWALFDHEELVGFDSIKSPMSWISARRIKMNTFRLSQLIDTIGENDHHDSPVRLYVVMEWQSHKHTGRHVQGLSVLGQSQGAVWHMAEYHRNVFAVDQVSERVWTRSGGKNAKKTDRTETAKAMFPEYRLAVEKNPKFDLGQDVADAIGLGWWRRGISSTGE